MFEKHIKSLNEKYSPSGKSFNPDFNKFILSFDESFFYEIQRAEVDKRQLSLHKRQYLDSLKRGLSTVTYPQLLNRTSPIKSPLKNQTNEEKHRERTCPSFLIEKPVKNEENNLIEENDDLNISLAIDPQKEKELREMIWGKKKQNLTESELKQSIERLYQRRKKNNIQNKEEEEEKFTFSPKIDKKSKKLIESSGHPFIERMIADLEKRNEKLKLKREKLKKEEEELTSKLFSPRITNKAKKMKRDTIEAVLAWNENKHLRLQKKREDLQKIEFSFIPKISKRSEKLSKKLNSPHGE